VPQIFAFFKRCAALRLPVASNPILSESLAHPPFLDLLVKNWPDIAGK